MRGRDHCCQCKAQRGKYRNWKECPECGGGFNEHRPRKCPFCGTSFRNYEGGKDD